MSLSAAYIQTHPSSQIWRVKTDCITFKEELEFDDVNLVLEDKTTGVMKFHDANCYHNMTTGYKSKQYDRVVNKKNMD